MIGLDSTHRTLPSVDLATVTDHDDQDQQPPVLDPVDDPVVSGPDTVEPFSPGQLLDAGGTRVASQRVNAGNQPTKVTGRQPEQITLGPGGDLDPVFPTIPSAPQHRLD